MQHFDAGKTIYCKFKKGDNKWDNALKVNFLSVISLFQILTNGFEYDTMQRS